MAGQSTQKITGFCLYHECDMESSLGFQQRSNILRPVLKDHDGSYIKKCSLGTALEAGDQLGGYSTSQHRKEGRDETSGKAVGMVRCVGFWAYLKRGSVEFADGLVTGYRRQRGVRDESKECGQSNQEDEVAIHCDGEDSRWSRFEGEKVRNSYLAILSVKYVLVI